MFFPSQQSKRDAKTRGGREIGIRFSKEVQKKYILEFDSSIYKSYNSIMHGYVLIPEKVLENLDNVAQYLDESYDYIMSLDPK